MGLTLSMVDCGFERRSGQTKDYKTGIFCFSAAALRSKDKDWLAGNLDIVSEWSDAVYFSELAL